MNLGGGINRTASFNLADALTVMVMAVFNERPTKEIKAATQQLSIHLTNYANEIAREASGG